MVEAHPKKKKEMMEWPELFLSVKKCLIDSGKITEDVVENMKKEFVQALNDPCSVLFDAFFQAKGMVD